MKNLSIYKELYNFHEGDAEMHPSITETTTYESQLSEYLKAHNIEVDYELERLYSLCARAWEKSGFLYGLNFCSSLEDK